MSTVERHELAPGLSVSRVLTGLWQIADMERDDRELDLEAAAAAIGPYAEAGLTTFDMADHYGSAEEIVGRYRRRPDAGEIQALTKWVPPPGPISKADVVQAVERALERLQSDRIDLLQFHAWSYADPGYLDALFELAELREQGLVRHLGVTNFDTAHLRVLLASGLPIVSNQVSYSLLDRRAARGMAALCAQRGVGILAYGTLAGGLLTDRYLDLPAPSEFPTWSLMKYRRFLRQAGGWPALQKLLGTLSGVASRLGVSIANLACRYVLEQPAVAGIIVGARLSESEHIAESLRLFEFGLDAEARAEIDAALAELRPIPGDCGDEYRRPPFLTASGDLSHHFEAMPPAYHPEQDGRGRTRVSSGTRWESLAGYSRAVRDGRRIWVSGTTATHGTRLIGGDDPAAQTHFAIDKVEAAIESLGGSLEDVVRTRVFVHDAAHWEAISRAHGDRFGGIRPANTLVEARLIGQGYLVEIEAEAVVSGASPTA